MGGKSGWRARTKKRRFRKGRTRKRSRITKSFARKVGAVVNRGRETKQVYAALAATAFNSGISGTGDIQALVPNMGNGTAESQRIGNEVQAKSMTVRGSIVYNPSAGQFGTYANARLGVRLMIVQPKAYATSDAVYGFASTWLPELLRKDGTQVAFTGLLDDLYAPINTDVITCYYNKVFYLQGPFVSSATGSVQMIGATKFFSKKINFRGAGKKLRYDANYNSGLSPTNYCPVMLLGYTHMDGSAPDVATTALQLNWSSVLNFTDA